MRRGIATAAGLLVAGGGVAAAVGWTASILTDDVSDEWLAFAMLAGATTSAGLLAAGLSLPIGVRLSAGWVMSALLLAFCALSFYGLVLAPLALGVVAAAALATSRETAPGGVALLASLGVYGLGALVLEGLSEDGAYSVVVFGPTFGAAWPALGVGIVLLARRAT